MSKQKRCLWVRRKSGNWELVCSGCGRRVNEIHTSTRQKFITGGEQPGDGAGRCVRAERNKETLDEFFWAELSGWQPSG